MYGSTSYVDNPEPETRRLNTVRPPPLTDHPFPCYHTPRSTYLPGREIGISLPNKQRQCRTCLRDALLTVPRVGRSCELKESILRKNGFFLHLLLLPGGHAARISYENGLKCLGLCPQKLEQLVAQSKALFEHANQVVAQAKPSDVEVPTPLLQNRNPPYPVG